MQLKECDEQIVALAGGDDDALRILYTGLSSAVYNLAFSIVKSRELAEDVMQDTFIKVKTHAASYRPGTNSKAWILTIARNLAITALRKGAYEYSADYLEETGATELSSSGRVATTVENSVLVEKALAVLSDTDRQIVMLHIVGGLKHREISEMMSIPLGSVLWKYSNALKKMSKYLNQSSG
ncbi:MAG: RNA polymerase sigma factor [Oscillospiraceae bacterium]|jgi:RNA polymerase sigma factor (sigma-70 family)|nr:RNA polymerase sigma factor [Oscillospiraceae bacterium]